MHGVARAAVLDRRFLFEETFETTKDELLSVIGRALSGAPGVTCDVRDLMVVDPVRTPDGSPVGAGGTAMPVTGGVDATGLGEGGGVACGSGTRLMIGREATGRLD